eukprot:scaffold92035_cov48-Phaeocystis_antarctica.AAC.1
MGDIVRRENRARVVSPQTCNIHLVSQALCAGGRRAAGSVQYAAEGAADGQVGRRQDVDALDHLCQLPRTRHDAARSDDRRRALARPLPWKPGAQPVGLRRAGGLHGELLRVAARPHLPERAGAHLRLRHRVAGALQRHGVLRLLVYATQGQP